MSQNQTNVPYVQYPSAWVPMGMRLLLLLLPAVAHAARTCEELRDVPPYFARALAACAANPACSALRAELQAASGGADRSLCCADALCAPLDACDIAASRYVNGHDARLPAAVESCAVLRGEYCLTDELLAGVVVCNDDDDCKDMKSTGVRTVELPMCCYNDACTGLHDCAIKEEHRKALFLMEDEAMLREQCQAAHLAPAGAAACLGDAPALAAQLVDDEKPRGLAGMDAEGMLYDSTNGRAALYLPLRRHDKPDTRTCAEIKTDHRDGVFAAALFLILMTCLCFQFCMWCDFWFWRNRTTWKKIAKPILQLILTVYNCFLSDLRLI